MTKIIDKSLKLIKDKSIYKYKYVDRELLFNLHNRAKHKFVYHGPLKTHSRSSTILPCFLNVVIDVYNGRKYIRFLVQKEHLGYKLGQFIYTRSFKLHKKQSRQLKIRAKKAKVDKDVYFFYKDKFTSLDRKSIFLDLNLEEDSSNKELIVDSINES